MVAAELQRGRSPRLGGAALRRPSRTEEPFLSREERLAAGKALRKSAPRERHAAWKPDRRRDPLAVLRASNRDRLPELVPIRYGRMLRSPFTFFRGSAGLMAADLASGPASGPRVQACGDCHLMNFGLFATPERSLIFDINDFDETLPAPWEWDVKRLAASFAVAARDNGHSEADARAAAAECVRSYREHLREDSKKSPLDVWYERMDVPGLIADAPDARERRRRAESAVEARHRIAEHLFPKISAPVDGRFRLIEQPPLLFHVAQRGAEKVFREALEGYRRSMFPSLRVLLDRYRLEDFAIKVVGIGSVGTRCYVALFSSAEGQPLLLQFKEAAASVLEPYAGKSSYDNHGERVVVGQRLMQSSSDYFLGWTRSDQGRDFFGRQLRDMKWTAPIAGSSPRRLKLYAELCGKVLGRAHAKSGDAAMISGYLGRSDVFDQAVGVFALRYAEQTERDHAALADAVKKRRIEAVVEEDL